MAYFAQDGHADQTNYHKAYKQCILKNIEKSWNLFHQNFLGLWKKHKYGNRKAYLPSIYHNPELLSVVQKNYMTGLIHDSLGFGSAKMIRTQPRLRERGHVEAAPLAAASPCSVSRRRRSRVISIPPPGVTDEQTKSWPLVRW